MALHAPMRTPWSSPAGFDNLPAMDHPFRDLIEQQIEKFRAQGGLSDLKGEGKPLPPQDPHVDAATAAGMRMMAAAGAMPKELTLRVQIEAARTAYKALTDPAEKKAAMAKLADLELRHNIARDARRTFMG